tara:strand:- start:134 stop:340 length:207 start_codon:yes stop_codon:yes gene_type:complete
MRIAAGREACGLLLKRSYEISRGSALMVSAHEHNLARTHRRKNAILRLLSQEQAPIDKKSSGMIFNVA